MFAVALPPPNPRRAVPGAASYLSAGTPSWKSDRLPEMAGP